MTGPRKYTDEDKAKVFTQLTVNEGNVLRTSRELDVPQATVRLWKKTWDKNGLPDAVQEELPAVVAETVSSQERVRDMALLKIEELIPEATVKNLSTLATVYGILTDKIDRAKGLDKQTHKHEVEHTITNPDAVAESLKSLMVGAIDAANERHQIIDVEVEEQAPLGLPPAHPNKE